MKGRNAESTDGILIRLQVPRVDGSELSRNLEGITDFASISPPVAFTGNLRRCSRSKLRRYQHIKLHLSTKISPPMESNADFCQENFKVLSAKVLFSGIANFLKAFTT